MITSASLKRTVKVAALTIAFAGSGSGIALAGTGTTSGDQGILGGNQVSVPITVPVNVCGNAIAVLGDALGLCQGGASAGSTGTSSDSTGASGSATSGNGSIGGGNQVSVPITVPVNVCGNSVAVLGSAASSCPTATPTPTPPPHKPGPPPHKPGPPPAHHRHHGRTVTPVPHLPAAAVTTSGTLPTTGANLAGLLALAGSVTVGGAGSLMLLARRRLARGVLAVTRRATHAFSAAR